MACWCIQISIAKGEECMLLDNTRRTRWRVRNYASVEGLVPAICFYIPPPNKDAEELAKTYVFHLSDLHDCDSTRLCGSADRIERKLITIDACNLIIPWYLGAIGHSAL